MDEEMEKLDREYPLLASAPAAPAGTFGPRTRGKDFTKEREFPMMDEWYEQDGAGGRLNHLPPCRTDSEREQRNALNVSVYILSHIHICVLILIYAFSCFLIITVTTL